MKFNEVCESVLTEGRIYNLEAKMLKAELVNIAESIQAISNLFDEDYEFMDLVIANKEWDKVIKAISNVSKNSLDEVAYELEGEIANLVKILDKKLP